MIVYRSGSENETMTYELRRYPPQFYYLKRSEAFSTWKFKLKIILKSCKLADEYKVSDGDGDRGKRSGMKVVGEWRSCCGEVQAFIARCVKWWN